jgi:hypothetical protein
MSASANLTQAGLTLVVRVQLPPQRRGGRKLVIGPTGVPWSGPRTLTDTTIVKALARAHRWKAMLDSGEHASLTELAKAEKITLSYLSRILRVTLLAPDIVEAIMNGQDIGPLQLSDLLRPLSVIWDEQRQALSTSAEPHYQAASRTRSERSCGSPRERTIRTAHLPPTRETLSRGA